MNANSVIIFVLGAAAGGVAAFFGTQKYMEKKYSRISQENKELKEYLDFLRSRDEAENLSENLGYVAKDGENDQNESVKTVKNCKNDASEGEKTKKTDYTRYYKEAKREENAVKMENYEEFMAENEHPEDDEPDPNEDYELKKAVELLNDTKKKPVIINSDEFDQYPYHDKVSLLWYTEDKILATENNEELDDPIAYLGEVFEKSGFTREDNEDDVIYIRNFSRGTDYEIGKVYGSMYD